MFSLPRSIPRVHAAALHTSNHDFPKPKILTPTPNQGSYIPTSITIRVNGCHVLPAQTPACVDRARADVWYALTRHVRVFGRSWTCMPGETSRNYLRWSGGPGSHETGATDQQPISPNESQRCDRVTQHE